MSMNEIQVGHLVKEKIDELNECIRQLRMYGVECELKITNTLHEEKLITHPYQTVTVESFRKVNGRWQSKQSTS